MAFAGVRETSLAVVNARSGNRWDSIISQTAQAESADCCEDHC